MRRYLAIATAIVCTVVAALVALAGGGRYLVRGGHAAAGATPSPPQVAGAGGAEASRAFRGDAPWALSALPACYRQISLRRDVLAVVRQALPPAGDAVPRRSRLTTGTCRLDVGDGRLRVARGDDLFSVPDVAHLYVARDAAGGDSLVLFRRGNGLPEMRRYRLVVPSVLAIPGRGDVRLESKS